MKTLVIVESSCVGATYTGKAAQLLGYKPLFLADKHGSQGETRERMDAFDVLECDTSSIERMMSALDRAGIADVGAVISLCDTNIMSAVELGEALGARTVSAVARTLKDKGNVLSMVPEYSPPSIVFDADKIPYARLAALCETNWRVIFKACCSSGGLGSFSVEAVDSNSLEKQIRESGVPSHLKPEKWIAQGFIEGRLVSLEGYAVGSTPVFLGFSGRKKIGMTESALIFPIDDELNEKARSKAKEAVARLIERSGFTNGYFHVEFMVDGTIPYLIDANMGRIGGGGLSEQFAVAFGVDPVTIYRHILALSLEQRDEGGARLFIRPTKQTWSAMYGIPRKAVLKRVVLPEGFESYHTRILDYETLVPPMGVDNYSWIGIVSGEAGLVEKSTQKIRIDTSEGSFCALY